VRSHIAQRLNFCITQIFAIKYYRAFIFSTKHMSTLNHKNIKCTVICVRTNEHFCDFKWYHCGWDLITVASTSDILKNFRFRTCVSTYRSQTYRCILFNSRLQGRLSWQRLQIPLSHTVFPRKKNNFEGLGGLGAGINQLSVCLSVRCVFYGPIKCFRALNPYEHQQWTSGRLSW
jgi:hypothetical protein